ncbi:MAG TPA: hypothetical protein VK457_25030, partial [Chloroflexota bacterium]|nr:hypothetical protein [Chloroflexota bacterium]
MAEGEAEAVALGTGVTVVVCASAASAGANTRVPASTAGSVNARRFHRVGCCFMGLAAAYQQSNSTS